MLAQPTDPDKASEETTTNAGIARNVLRLDRGHDQPLELSLHLDRERAAHNSQVYNDMLIVSNLYGEAELKEGPATTEFSGRDFSEFDGIEVEIEEARLPDLIAALERLSVDQNYGQVVVPHDLGQVIDSSRIQVDKLLRTADPDLPLDSARAYLPSDLLHERMRNELSGDDLKRLGRMEDPNSAPSGMAGSPESQPDRKLKLLLRLR
jgi:hypothetical protein